MENNRMLFCKITWMKNYRGITEDDMPINGGKWVGENNDAGESENFRPYNHYCRGYVQTNTKESNAIALERIQKEYKGDSIDGVTVVWVATSPKKGQYIAGWYNNATVNRFWKTSKEPARVDSTYQDYCITAKESDCVLLPEEKRTFVIPRASKVGRGRGMGESHIWYADTDAAKEIKNDVLDYIKGYSDETIKIYYTAEELEYCIEDTGQSLEELELLLKYTSSPYESLRIANLAIKKDYSYDTLLLKVNALRELRCYDEEEEILKRVLYERSNDKDAMKELFYIRFYMEKYALAVETGERLLSMLYDGDTKARVAFYMAKIYLSDNMPENAEEYLLNNKEICRRYIGDAAVKNLLDAIREAM